MNERATPGDTPPTSGLDAENRVVAAGYPLWPDKGPIVNGVRLTLMSARANYRRGESVQVVHVADHTEPGRQVYAMGPKPVYGEYVDGQPATPAPPADEDPLAPLLYDGLVLASPQVDANYEVTTYVLPPGEHEIRWEMGDRRSNVLRVRVDDR